MSELLGRKVTLSVAGTVFATARTKTLEINNESVDVTSDGDEGIRRLLDEPGEKSWSMSLDGMFDGQDATLVEKALNKTDGTVAVVLTYPTYTLTGTGFMESYSESKPYNDAITFSSNFVGTGELVKAPVT